MAAGARRHVTLAIGEMRFGIEAEGVEWQKIGDGGTYCRRVVVDLLPGGGNYALRACRDPLGSPVWRLDRAMLTS